MRELKPCPFCGMPGMLIESTWFEEIVFYVRCCECTVQTSEHLNRLMAEAIAEWNTRPIEDKLQERIDALEWMFEVDEYVIEHEHPVCMARGNSSKRGQLFNRAAKEYDSIRAAAHAAVEKK